MKNFLNSKLFAIIICALIFGIPYLWRRYRDSDIEQHRKYAFARIVKKTGSLKNGTDWYYDFYFQNILQQGHWPTHVDYAVTIGDYFLVTFSSKDPSHNKILYDHKLKTYDQSLLTMVWDTIPKLLIISGRK
jgi:hypothetical protein